MKGPKLSSIEINPTELCNLRCSFCPRSTFYPNRNLNMSLDMARFIRKELDEAWRVGWRGRVSMTGRGEPTLHPQFDELTEIFARDRKYHLLLTTNGKRLDRYIEDGTADKYDRIVRNIYEAQQDDANILKKKYQEYKNVEVYWKPDIEGETTWENYFYEGMSRGFTNRAGSFEGTTTKGWCDRPWNKMFIDWNGDYKLCCEDWKHDIVMGNIQTENIHQYYTKNKKLNMFREKLTKGLRDIAPCNECSYCPHSRVA